jgi:hypothetical protein
MSSRVAEAIRARVAAHQAPGVVGITDPQMMADSGVPWTSAQIELWRDQELAWLDRVLLEAPGRDPDQAARIGLALADVRVRDVTLALSVRQEHTEAVAAALWPVAASLPQPRWSAPTGSVLALCEWINGRDPIRVLDLTAPGLGYPLADLTRRTHAAGASAQQMRTWALGEPLDAYRYGSTHRDLADAGEGDELMVLGAALNRAGWAVEVAQVDAETGMLVGYLLREHTRVAVVEARVDLDDTGALIGGTGALDFAADRARAGDWRAVVGNAGVSDGEAVGALLAARGLDLASPRAAARMATSPTVMAATDQLIARTGPTRGPGRH